MDPQLIIAAIQAAMKLIELAQKAAGHLKQSGELSKEDEVKIDAKIAELKNKPWWQVPEGE